MKLNKQNRIFQTEHNSCTSDLMYPEKKIKRKGENFGEGIKQNWDRNKKKTQKGILQNEGTRD